MNKVRKQPYKKPQAVKDLEALAWEVKRQRFPDVPDYILVSEKYRDDSANGLTRCVIAYIQLLGGQAERINTMGRPIDQRKTFTDVLGHTRQVGSVKWIPGTSTRGSADISATIQGRSVKIEIKFGKDRQSEAQRKYAREVEAAGGIYYVCKDFTSFVDWYGAKFGRAER